MKPEFPRKIFVKYPNVKCDEKSHQWKPSYCMRQDGQTDRQTDRYDEANSRFTQFRERA